MEYLHGFALLPDEMVRKLGLVGKHAAALRASDALFLSMHSHVLLHVTPPLDGFGAICVIKNRSLGVKIRQCSLNY